MTFKFEVEQWLRACEAFDDNNYDEALKTFITIADNAKMHFNIGSIFSILNDHKRAITAFNRAIARDPYFAVAYFQRGVSLFLLGDLESAENDFDLAFQKLRGNCVINYQQLGLQFRLYCCEVLFNRGICQLYLGKIDSGLTDLYHAQKAKETEEHNIIDQAVRARGKGYSVYSLPPGLLFRPSEIKLRQLRGMNIFQEPLPHFTSILDSKNSTFLYQQQNAYDYSPTLYPTEHALPPSPLSPDDGTSKGFERDFDVSPKENHYCQSNAGLFYTPTRPHSITSSNSSQLSLQSNGSSSRTCSKKLKIKCHYNDTRILLASTDINFRELKLRIAEKFNTNPDSIQLSYEDEEQERVLIVDDEDLEMARQINQARRLVSLQQTPTTIEKLEIWL